MLTEANAARRKEARISFSLLVALSGVLIFWTVLSWPVLLVTMAAGVVPCAFLLLIWISYFIFRSDEMRRCSGTMSGVIIFLAVVVFPIIGSQQEAFAISFSEPHSLINVLPWLNVAVAFTLVLTSAAILAFNRCCTCCYCHCCDRAHCCQAAEDEIIFLCSD